MAAAPASRAPASEPLVIFTPSGRRGRVAAGTTVLDAARGLGVDIDSVCGGRGICGRCQVTPAEGSFPKHGITSSAVAPGARRRRRARLRRARTACADDRRLACLAHVSGDLVIDVPPESQVHRQVVRKALDRPHVRRSTRSCASITSRSSRRSSPPRRATSRGCTEALEREWDLHDLEADLDVVRASQRRAGEGRLPRHRRRPRRPPADRDLAGLSRPGVRRRDRRGVHDDRRAPRRTSTTARSSRPTA